MVEGGMTPEADEMFVSAARTSENLAGVFEHDGESGYFYLYDQSRPENSRIAGAIQYKGRATGQGREDEWVGIPYRKV